MRINKKFLTLLLITVVIFHERILHMIRTQVPQNVDIYNANIKAFLMTIRQAEGTAHTAGYNTFVGGTTFKGNDKHPQQYFVLNIRDKATGKTKQVRSSAAGAYQFIYSTWNRLQKKLNLPDFSKESQDRAALELIAERGAISDVIKGNIEVAALKCSKEWASLPGSTAGQNPKAMNQIKEYFIKHGGTPA